MLSFNKGAKEKIIKTIKENIIKYSIFFIYILVIFMVFGDFIEDFYPNNYLKENHIINDSFIKAFDGISFVFIVGLLFYQVYQSYNISKKLKKANNLLVALKGSMSDYVENQFLEWNFTKAEKEIGWLSLKGYSPKEIASFRDVKEKTIHSQLNSIYTKSQLSSRHEFISNFLEVFINMKSSD